MGLWPWSEDSKQRTIKKLKASVGAHVRTIKKGEMELEEAKERIRELETQLQTLPTLDSHKQLKNKVGELELRLSSSKDQFGTQLETLEKELSKEMGSKSELESFIKQMLKAYLPIKDEEHIGFSPRENIGYATLIHIADLRDTFSYREIFYLQRKFWYLHLGRIAPAVKELVISGLPIEGSEDLSHLPCKVVVVSYDAEKLKAPEGVTALTPQQYLKKRDGKNSPIYNSVDLLTQLIDGRNVRAPKDVIEEAQLIARKSPYLTDDYLTELKHELIKHGTIKNHELRRRLIGVYEN